MPTTLVDAVMSAESSGNKNATSNKGASGLMQLMPATARSLGVTDIYDPEQNINAGVKYLSQMYKQFGNWQLALAAYNAGPGRIGGLIKKYGNSWSAISKYAPGETQKYVSKIMKNWGG